ncbi:hypothetical protein V5P93_003636 [Actinokineospora auranticolor]|uniref:Uncharacterized protein n=1 Tax=Actinokineospora auranticolor TaxID=155976 RepID=A0A2S6GJ06_9PSEU|nr:hypothetical protein [Actinokineospora auranticolor]PPK65199.1 hypothetical protein CLV40_11546 [Actinokineospora auranticolor]
MEWVRRHRRRVPGSWFRTTTVRSHHRSRSRLLPLAGIVIAVLVILLLVVLF